MSDVGRGGRRFGVSGGVVVRKIFLQREDSLMHKKRASTRARPPPGDLVQGVGAIAAGQCDIKIGSDC
jgi:hypothetical protein